MICVKFAVKYVEIAVNKDVDVARLDVDVVLALAALAIQKCQETTVLHKSIDNETSHKRVTQLKHKRSKIVKITLLMFT